MCTWVVPFAFFNDVSFTYKKRTKAVLNKFTFSQHLIKQEKKIISKLKKSTSFLSEFSSSYGFVSDSILLIKLPVL